MTATLQTEVLSATVLRFDDGAPVRAASAVTAYEDGWLVVQDDATHGAWWVGGSITPLRVFPPVDGHDSFSPAEGTKHLKPDLEAALPVPGPGGGVLLLGSGSTSSRMQVALLRGRSEPVRTADLSPVYAAVAAALGMDLGLLNLEGACVVGPSLRWFHRGAADVPSASVDLPLDALLACFDGPRDVPLGTVRRYDLGTVDGVALAVTDALALPDGTVLVSAAAEDTPDPYEDGPVIGAALAVLDDEGVQAQVRLPALRGVVQKVEGLAPCGVRRDGLEVLAVVDADDPEQPSTALVLDVRR